jgi:hypothetical protein
MKLSTKTVVVLSLLVLVLSGCYVVPLDSEGRPIYPSHPVYPTPVSPASGAPTATSLPARLYPANDIATETGVVTGVVTNMMTGKGRFNLNYRGDTLIGEATRISGDERRGVASAYSPSGAYMSCEYQMNTPRQGAGTCTFSNGAEYKLHIGGG